MVRFAIVWSIVMMLGTLSFSQEIETPERKQQPTGERRRDEGRRRYQRDKVTVKDPTEFKTEGKQIFSGPQAGEKLPKCKAIGLAGENKGKEFDPTAPGADGLQVIIFEDESGVAIRGLFGVSDAVGKINRKSKKDIHTAVVFLSDDEQKINQFARVFPRLLERGVDSISFSQDGRDGPGAYGLDRTVSQTVILAKKGKVVRNFAFPQGMLYADAHLLGGIAELVGEDRETVAAWLAEGGERDERMRMRGGDGKATGPKAADVKAAFREKLREFVEAGKLNREEAGELYKAAFPEREQQRQ